MIQLSSNPTLSSAPRSDAGLPTPRHCPGNRFNGFSLANKQPFFFTFFALFLSTLTPRLCAAQAVPLTPSTAVAFATPGQARAILQASSVFTKAMTPFDRCVRMKTVADPGEAAFLRFAAGQVRPWEPADIEKLEKSIRAIAAPLSRYRLSLPSRVLLIKTTGAEEGGCAYTCGAAIVLPAGWVARWPARSLGNIITHELFHVMTRHNPALRSRLFALIGFRPCPPIELPAALRGSFITNPDSPLLDHVITVTSGTRPLDVVPVLLLPAAQAQQSSNPSFVYGLDERLLALDRRGGHDLPRLEASRPVLLDPGSVPDFFSQTGRTSQTIQPEEIMANNFELLADPITHKAYKSRLKSRLETLGYTVTDTTATAINPKQNLDAVTAATRSNPPFTFINQRTIEGMIKLLAQTPNPENPL